MGFGICQYANCCPSAATVDNLRVLCTTEILRGSPWYNFANTAWSQATDTAFTCITDQCVDPDEVLTGLSGVRLKNSCPALPSGTQPGMFATDRTLFANAFRAANAIQIGHGTFVPGVRTTVTYEVGVLALVRSVPVGNTIEQTTGAAKIRFYVTVRPSATLDEGMHYVTSRTADSFCAENTPPPIVCTEDDITLDSMRAVFGSMPNPGAPSQDNQPRWKAIWRELASPRPQLANQFVTDLSQSGTVFYESALPCQHVATDDTWYFAVTPMPMCFDEKGFSLNPPGNVMCQVSGCTQGFGECIAARQQIRKFAFGHVSRIEFLTTNNNIIEAVDLPTPV